jgi:glycerol-3-phosphate cytidylyltransferase
VQENERLETTEEPTYYPLAQVQPRPVLVPGVFDLFHHGHVNLLRAARELASGESVLVALASDDHARSLKDGTGWPVLNYREREKVLSACRYVDRVYITTPKDPAAVLIVRHQPKLIIHDAEWSGASYRDALGITREDLDLLDCRIVYVDRTEGISSTLIRNRITAGEREPIT